MVPATGSEWHDRILGWGKHPTAIICVVLIGALLLVLAMPSPWGLGAFEPNQPPVRIVSFQLNLTPVPAGPRMALTLENFGGSPIVYLAASLGPQAVFRGLSLNFPSVNATSPLAPGQSVMARALLQADNLTCGSFYIWTVSGITGSLSSGSAFEIQTGAPVSCVDGIGGEGS